MLCIVLWQKISEVSARKIFSRSDLIELVAAGKREIFSEADEIINRVAHRRNLRLDIFK